MSITLLAGTSGSGKTYIMERLIAALGPYDFTFPLGPRGAVGGSLWEERRIAIIGRYEGAACGGCDGLSWKGGADDIEAKIVTLAPDYGIFLEGLLVAAWGVARLARLAPLGLTVVQLTTPLDVCLADVTARREARAAAAGKPPPAPLNPTNTISKHAGIANVAAARRNAGVNVLELDRAAALTYVLTAAGV